MYQNDINVNASINADNLLCFSLKHAFLTILEKIWNKCNFQIEKKINDTP